MKRLFLLLSIVMIGFASQAQTPGFPSLDSLSKYNNHYIKNSAVEAFANLRLNTLLHGIIWWIDTAMNRAIAGGDTTILTAPHGHGNGNGHPGAIRFNDTLFVFEVSKDTIWTAILLEAANGVHKIADSVMWGGPLIYETDIDQQGNGITFHDGMFKHEYGTYSAFSNPYSLSYDSSTYNWLYKRDGAGSEVQILSSLPGQQIYLSSSTPSGSSTIDIHGPDGIFFLQSDGKIFFPTGTVLPNVATPYVFYYNPDDGQMSYALGGGGGGGGGGAGIGRVYTVNGLNNLDDSTAQLGGTLNQITTIVAGSLYKLSVTGSHATAGVLEGKNSSSGIGVYGETLTGKGVAGYATGSNGIGLYGQAISSGGIGLFGISSNFYGLWAQSTTGIPVLATMDPTSTNTQVEGIRIRRLISGGGTPATGNGAYIGLRGVTLSSSDDEAGRIGYDFTNVTTATKTSRLTFGNYLNGSFANKMIIEGSGQLKLPLYTGTTFDGAVVKGLGVDVAGNIWTYDVGGVGGVGASTDEFDPVYFDVQSRDVTNPITLKPSVVALQTDISDLNARIDSLLNNFPAGALITDIQDVNDRIDSLLNDFPAGGAPEINTKVITLSATGSLTMTVEGMLEYILVKPTTSLTGFKIGTVADDDYFFTATPVTATATFQEFVVQRYVPSSTAIYFSGITSSTQIKLVYKPMHQ